MSDPKITKVKNECGEIIEVGGVYQLGDVRRDACDREKVFGTVKIISLRHVMDDYYLADYEIVETDRNDPTNPLALKKPFAKGRINIDLLFSDPLVSSIHRPLDGYTDKIRKS